MLDFIFLIRESMVCCLSLKVNLYLYIFIFQNLLFTLVLAIKSSCCLTKHKICFWNALHIRPIRPCLLIYRSRHTEVFLGKGVLKKCSKFTGEHPCQSLISIKLLKQLYWNHTSAWVFSCKFAALFRCSAVNLLRYFENTFS